MKMFSVYDSKVGAYLAPFFAKSAGEALRMFEDAVNSEGTLFANHPADFTLFEVGEFGELSGELMPREVKIALGLALDFVRDKGTLPLMDRRDVRSDTPAR